MNQFAQPTNGQAGHPQHHYPPQAAVPGQAAYGQAPHPGAPHAQAPHAQSPHAQMPHAQAPHAQAPHPQAPHAQAHAQNPQLALDKKQQAMLGEFDLLPNEQIVYTIQGDGFFIGANPVAKAIAALQASLVKLTGGHVRIFVVVTNQRIVMVESRSVWCGFMRHKAVNAIALASLAEAGWGRETQWCCIHSRAVHLQSKTQRYTLVIKRLGDHALREFVANLSSVLVGNAQLRTAT